MHYYRICINPTGRVVSRRAREIIDSARSLGITPLTDVHTQTLYFLRGDLTPQDLDSLCATLLVDPVIETATWDSVEDPDTCTTTSPGGAWVVEVGLHPGVTDAVANQIVETAGALGVQGLQAATGQRYELIGALTEEEVRTIARRLLCNETIQHYYLGRMVPAFPAAAHASDRAATIALAACTDEELVALSRERLLALNVNEMRAIRDYFLAQKREPTDVELETLAQTWSEHCVHKTFKALIDFEEAGHSRLVDGILRSTIRAATEKVNKPWVRSAFVDNAGIIDFDDRYEVSFKVETHNHPSALEPFGGANTGVGGVVRDVLGVSARPIAVTDVLCFGPQDMPMDQVPDGSLHPQRIKAGVVSGVEDYGNKLGLPTVSGAILYDESFTANPLVFVGCLGIAPIDSHPTAPQTGDLVVVIGGRTGRDGLHGATFSSESLTHETGQIAGTAVQIGDPITEKDVMEVVCQARDMRLYSAITDCGAGGLSSAVGELGSDIGVDVQLDDVPLKYPGLQPWEIWLSEAQERMVLSVRPDHWPRLRELCSDWNVEATVIGHFTDTGRLVVRHGGQIVADLDMNFLHHGIPREHLRATWSPPAAARIDDAGAHAGSCAEALLALLAHPNIASKADTIRRYDHEVGGGTTVKPLVGAQCDGPSDAAVLKPLQTRHHAQGLALSLGVNPEIGKVDPYAMAVSVVDEAIRNAVAVGADPDRIALLDNFCWGNPRRPEQLGALVRAAEGCYDAAIAYGTPFISGKDSLNNEYIGPDGKPTPIPGTLLVSALGIIPDVEQAVTMDLKEAGNLILLVGETRNELAGSHYARIASTRRPVGCAPTLPGDGLSCYRALHQAMRHGLICACHDLSEGGLGVAAAEMCIAGRQGMRIRLADVSVDDNALDDGVRLFSESNGRFLVEAPPECVHEFREVMAGHPVTEIGITCGNALRVAGVDGSKLLSLAVTDLASAWLGGAR
jgi:phosphoribosylformylglycinamidine synthase subunit PurSL